MWKTVVFFAMGALVVTTAQALEIDIYVDAAPNAYGSPDYAAWWANAQAAAAAGTFVNMANGINPGNVGTTDFEIQDEVVYSFGDLGSRLTWVYWIAGATIADLTDNFEVSLINDWDGDVLDFYLDYYGATWLEPSSWVEYNGGVVGAAGMAWWGANGVNTQEALDADIYAWMQSNESWTFTARLLDEPDSETSLTSNRAAVPVPEPASMAILGIGIVGLVASRMRKQRNVA